MFIDDEAFRIPSVRFQEFTNNFPEVFHKPFYDNAKHGQVQADRAMRASYEPLQADPTELAGCHHMSSDLLLPR